MAARRDVVVVGAGVIGCAIAYELARRGASVEVVDERRVGMGATQASAGILAPYSEAHEGSPLLDLAVRSLALFDDFVGRVGADTGIAVRYQRSGTLDVAREDEMSMLRARAEWLARRGVSARLLDAHDLREEEVHLAPDVAGGLLIPAHGCVIAGELTHALAVAARKHGAQLVEGGCVRRITRGDGRTIVETERGSLSGDVVVLAAGSWSSRIEIAGVALTVPVRPVRGQLLQLGWSGPRLRRVTWGSRCYLVPWDGGTLFVGATLEEVGFDERVTVAGVRDLLEAACDLVPRAWQAGFVGARVGFRPASPDQLPIVGASRVMPDLVYATGHYRNGVLLAPLTAELVAKLILDRADDAAFEALAPARFGDL